MEGAGGNGFMFRARTEEDARLFRAELADRRFRSFPRAGALVTGAAVLIVVVLGLLNAG